MSNDWIPAREQDFTDLCQKWKTGLSETANIAAFGWNQTEVAAVLGAVDAFLTARAAYEADNSTAKRIAKDEAKGAATTQMRGFANTSIRYNKQMSDEAKLFYGIRPPDPTHTADTAPQTYPEAEGNTATLRQVSIHFWDSATKKRGKPRHVHGAEIRWAILGQPPASIEELTHSDFDTASPFTLTFDEASRGSRVYFCLRWESSTNLKGPYSEIYSATIP
ncbi:MAG: hypothetical protein LBD31_11120 [Treponema sp.]|jgi:hypothetical protein|nr:hypothetical protein [Treponema sp.]